MIRKAIALGILGFGVWSVVPVQAQADPVLPVIVGHGASTVDAPENSVPALDAYGDQGVTIFEVDLRLAINDPGPSAMFSHDDNIASKTDCTGLISTSWFGTLRGCSAADYPPWNTDPRFAGDLPNGSPKVPVMYIKDVLQAAQRHDARILIDVKAVPTQTQMANLVSYLDLPEFNLPGDPSMRSRIIWMANTTAGLTLVRGWYPDLRYWLLENPALETMRTCESMVALGAQGYAVPNYRITADKVTYWHSPSCPVGFEVATWTTNNAAYETPAEWSRVWDAGVNYIITNSPVQLRAVLEGGA